MWMYICKKGVCKRERERESNVSKRDAFSEKVNNNKTKKTKGGVCWTCSNYFGKEECGQEVAQLLVRDALEPGIQNALYIIAQIRIRNLCC